MITPVLRVKDLRKTFRSILGHSMTAVDDVSFELHGGQCLAIAGESGSGKTTVARIITGLEKADSGVVEIGGTSIVKRPFGRKARLERAKAVQMVFQNPFSSLDPARTIEEGVRYGMALHGLGSRAEQATRASEMLDRVGMGERERTMTPRRLSGGQLQRAAIARALCLEPSVLVLDEAVAALDVSIQAQILLLLKELQKDMNLSYVFISHDLAVLETIADDILVLRLGKAEEHGPIRQVLAAPESDYTKMLLDSVPRPGWKPAGV